MDSKLNLWRKEVVTINRFANGYDGHYGYRISYDEVDVRSMSLIDIDLTKVQLVTMLTEGEEELSKEENFRRLKESGHILLDADIIGTLLGKNEYRIPESWKGVVDHWTRYFINFYGTPLRDQDNELATPCMYYNRMWRGDLLSHRRVNKYELSAVLPVD